jgi:hypothetical protein
LAFANQESTHSIYIDGIIVYSGPETPIIVQNHSSVYFGTNQTYFVRAEFDDIKILKKLLRTFYKK